MSTITNNYGLTKPGTSDYYDIGIQNNNMDIIDGVLKASANSMADVFSQDRTYAVGNYCIHENLLYKCTTAVTIAGAWNAANWTATTIGSVLKEQNDNLATVNSAATAVGTINAGGFIKAGKIVLYHISIVLPSDVAAYTAILDSLPVSLTNGTPVICYDSNGNKVDHLYLTGVAIYSSIAVSAGTYIFAGSYISAS